MGRKRDAKLASRVKVAEQGEIVNSPVMLTGAGHRVSHNVTGRADCGVYMEGWRFGVDEDVTCRECSDVPV